MSDITIDAEVFGRRAAALQSAWKNAHKKENYEAIRDVDVVLAAMGAQNEDLPYSKTTTLHIWLLGYEFPSTLIMLTKDKITFVTSGQKAKLLEPLKDNKSGVKVDIMKRTKDDAANKETWKDLIGRIEKSTSGTKIGIFPKDKPISKFGEEWDAVWAGAIKEHSFESVDVGPAFGSVWAVKDQEELKLIKTAARMSTGVLKEYFVEEMSTILDEGKKVTHEKLAARIESKLEDAAFWKKIKGLQDADLGLADWCYTPIIQSGGHYDLRTSAQSNNKRLEGADGGGVVIASMGIKYKSYCTNVGRTYLIDPHKKQSAAYALLLEVQQEVAEKILRTGTTGRDVYNGALDFVRKRDAKLADSFVKSIGFAIGIEFRDSSYLLGPKNTRSIEADMTYNLTIGFQDIPDPNHSGQTYSLLLVDTVRVNEGPATFMTERVKSTSDLSFFKEEDEDADEAKESKKGKKGKARGDDDDEFEEEGHITRGGKVLRSRGGDSKIENVDNRIRDHQRELAQQKQEEGLARFAEDGAGEEKQNGKVWKKFESYKREDRLPSKTQDLKILLDRSARSVILPIYGYAVPFHINTIKNVSKSEEGEWTTLRFNFITPGQILGKKEDQPFQDPDATFVRSMIFRSQDTFHFGELYRDITEFKKMSTKEEAQKKELADVVEQDKLQLNKSRPIILREVFPRPALEGKRVPGDLEIHQNGIRFSSPLKEQRIDILFSNIKHLFFQPCDKELVVIIHMHLKYPIMVGKKKARDVQFYREASDVQFDETGNRKRKYRTGDEDEIELEQEERRRRHQLNKEFKAFAQKIAEASDGRFEVDTPYRELGFNGVPFRNNVFLMPTTDCLVHLTEPPFFVVTLSDVEIAHLERVQYGLKNFDLVFVMRDFSKAPVHINSIPSQALDSVKEWLDSVDLPVTEGAVNLNWTAIMKTVQEDPYAFFEEGGWGFLQAHGDDSDSASESSQGSDFADVMDDVSEVDSESDSDGSDFGASEEDDGSGSGSAASFDESEGEDWDELERKAAKADDKRRHEKGYDSDDDGKKRKGKKK
ncbi:putative SPT16-general chromatin factor [Tilletiaria anomala UBC 951]|uniref:FACT complex subunit n=1 Tax=Tilletiaria anomala (strain ATCC 24038 / CBS 436.72 / UBC 951) TaxID=1037660 RepID=A0A066WQ64_TILAU|nr:putative SPT16-general chromatin factor [Tilletiaria anomala UBC 951]KDN52765.1 putative SPT16-general chromatin factor [Tilletiaria anomala UBC 951]